jgi:hypothetical protein
MMFKPCSNKERADRSAEKQQLLHNIRALAILTSARTQCMRVCSTVASLQQLACMRRPLLVTFLQQPAEFKHAIYQSLPN